MRTLALVALVGCSASAPTTRGPGPAPAPADLAALGGEPLSYATADGVTIEGTYWPPDGATTGCAIFVHQLSSTRAEYAPVIARLKGRGHLYALDLRGHGASTRGPAGPISWHDFDVPDWAKVADDVVRAADAVRGKGAAADCVWVGASIGSNSVLFASAHAPERTRGLVLLSPGLDYRGLKAPEAAPGNRAPVLLVHSQEPGAADAATALTAIWRAAQPPVPVEEIADPGTAHGMKIVAGDAATLDRVVRFVGELLAR